MNLNPILFQELFSALALSPQASQLYLTLLEHPHVPAGRLTVLAGFKRGHTYSLLQELEGRGLAHSVEERGIKRFKAAAPALLIRQLEEQLSSIGQVVVQARELLPLLVSMTRASPGLPRLQVFRGSDGVKAIYEDTLTATQKVLYAFGDFDYTFPQRRSIALNRWMWRYASRRSAKNIWYDGILNKSAESDLAFKKRKAQKRRLKMITGAPLPVEINVYDNKVAVASTADEMMGMIVESQPIADSLRMIHRVLWSYLPNYHLIERKG